MLPIEQVLSFAHDYVNNKKERSWARKQKIRAVYRELTGKDIKGSCSTCYVEAVLEIIKSFKTFNMATANYELKRGVLLESFGHPEKTCTNDTLTDELAEWHLKECPAKSVYFARLPAKFITPGTLPPPPIPQSPRQQKETQILPPEIIVPPSKIAQEDPAKRKILIDRALELGFKSSPENPVELIMSNELEIIISNLEKAKTEVKKPVKKSSKSKK